MHNLLILQLVVHTMTTRLLTVISQFCCKFIRASDFMEEFMGTGNILFLVFIFLIRKTYRAFVNAVMNFRVP
jgi:hypothetical protein